jgi:hypothetical protein
VPIGIGVLIGALVSVPTTMWLGGASGRVLGRWEQPVDVSYGSFDPYALLLVEGARKWHVIGGDSHSYELRIVRRRDGADGYGHTVTVDRHGERSPEDWARACEVTWLGEGVTFAQPTGHRSFIPRSAFTGGR